MASGDLSKAPQPPIFADDWTLGKPDMVLTFPDPYILPAEGLDIYRNFVVPIPIQEKRYVRVVEFLPESQLVIHHAVMQLDVSDWSRNRDAQDAEPGFNGMEPSRALNPSGQFVGWTPGRITYEAQEGTAWEINPNTDLVVQLHMLPSGKPERIQPRIGLYFSDEPPTRQTSYVLLRANAIDIPANEPNYLIQESLVIPVDVSVLAVSPHAHYLAKDVQIFAELPDGSRQWLLRIPDWDFNWQSDYRYEEPLVIPAGSRFVMRYQFDNSSQNIRNPHSPPQRVVLGYNSTDEMAEAIIELLLHEVEDLGAVQAAQLGYEIEQQGGPAEYSFNLGVEMEELGRIQDAVAAYQSCLQKNPSHAMALNNLGAISDREGKLEEAEAFYRKSVASDPTLLVALSNLAKLLYRIGQFDESLVVFRNFQKQYPDELELAFQLSASMVERNQIAQALRLLQSVSQSHPVEPYLNLQLAKLLMMRGDPESAEKHLALSANGKLSEMKATVALKDVQAEANYLLALIARQEGDAAAMMPLIEKVLQLDPDHSEGRSLAAALALFYNKPDEALGHLRRLLTLPSERQPVPNQLLSELPYPEGTLLLAQVYQETGRQPVADQILQQGLEEARRQGNTRWVNLFQRAQAGF